ncbi:alpha-hydroxyketone-type quorum-sensing autoinducer synthase [Streptacidiphilus cavernicola]|uniref:8-amino-7-oxononanoate synthase n=1 Tax=Streptacidiphilus cavernicola TaxID=3342716 RepID=A0ABV6VXI0_9ACTN
MNGDPTPLPERFSAWDRRRAGWGGAIYRGRALPGPDDLVLMSNDYLALGSAPEVLQAQVDSLLRHGNGLMMSGAFTGDDDPRQALEQRFAELMRAPAAMLCQSGWAANVGLIQAVAPAGSPVYADVTAHMSLWAGIQAAGALARPFPHNDLEYLERLIGRHGPGLIAVDALYSVTGDLCPLAELVAVAERTGCEVVADESHTLGVLGPQGAGLTAALGLTERVAYRTVSLAKAFAGRAGLIACSRRAADFLPFHAYPAIFSSTLLPHDLAGLAAVLNRILTADDRRERLLRQSAALRAGLTAVGYSIAPSESWIVPLQPGTEQRISLLQHLLDGEGVFGAPFIPPAVGNNRCVHRLSVHSELTDRDLDRVLDACARVRDKAGVQDWKSTRRMCAATPTET